MGEWLSGLRRFEWATPFPQVLLPGIAVNSRFDAPKRAHPGARRESPTVHPWGGVRRRRRHFVPTLRALPRGNDFGTAIRTDHNAARFLFSAGPKQPVYVQRSATSVPLDARIGELEVLAAATNLHVIPARGSSGDRGDDA
jgi:hypothetical protein